MPAFFAKQIMTLALTIAAVSFIIFAMNEFSPGDVARKELGAYATQEQVDLLREKLGLDRPMIVRYVEYMASAAKGDLGMSQRFKVPVVDVLFSRLGNTAILAGICFAIIVPLSILLGTLAGIREGSIADRTIVALATFAASVPEFAMGVFLVSIFVVWLGLLPGTAPLLPDPNGWSFAAQLVLPVIVIVLYDLGYVVNMIRASMTDVMRRNYIRTAVLKGLPFRKVVTGHALRNALITPITVILLQINYLIAGVVVVETIFSYPGFGRMMLEAALSKDIALIEAGALVAVFVVAATQIASDIAYYLLDPRMRTA